MIIKEKAQPAFDMPQHTGEETDEKNISKYKCHLILNHASPNTLTINSKPVSARSGTK